MPIEIPVADRIILARYLLGQLSPDEEDRVEDRFAGDKSYFDLYQEVEQTLLRDYAAGTMKPLEVALFERNYLVTPERQQHATIVRALLAIEPEGQEALDQRSLRPLRLQAAMALALLLIAGVTVWTYRRSSHPPQSVAHQQVSAVPNRPASMPESSAERKVSPERQGEPASAADKVISMAKAGLSEDQILQAIVSGDLNGDVGAKDLVRLRKAGVMERVISALIDPSSVNRPVTAKAVPPPQDTFDPVGIKKRLVSKYALTRPSADKTDIVAEGSVLVLQKGKLVMALANASSSQCPNTYSDGKLLQSGSCQANYVAHGAAWTAFRSGASFRNIRAFVAGEKMRATAIEVMKAGVVFDLLSDPIAGVRYSTSLVFPLPRGSTPTADQVNNIVAEVFNVLPAVDANSAAQQPTGHMASMSSDKITIGETKEEVLKKLGPPSDVAGARGQEIYSFKNLQDLKVIFVDGKLIDAQ